MFTEKQLELLNSKLDPDHVKKNPKGFDYIEGWRAIAAANDIFGHGYWSQEILSLQKLEEGSSESRANFESHWYATVRITAWGEDGQKRNNIRDGVGYGMGYGKTLGEAAEVGIKGAATDAMKRALITFGWPFGLALYDDERAHVGKEEPESAPKKEVEEKEPTPSQSIADQLERLRNGLQAIWNDFGKKGKQRAREAIEEYSILLMEGEDWMNIWMANVEPHALEAPDLLPKMLKSIEDVYRSLKKEDQDVDFR
jgi:DNA repair and recombination protein RAD52